MEAESFYHIYNRGNNRQRIFFNRENYIYFLLKVRKHFIPHLDILTYCLMPNHFHFLAYTKPSFEKKAFSNSLKVMLRSYTRAINKQEGRVGSLFQQNTKIKSLEYDTHGMTLSHAMSSKKDMHPFICFHYIHQNPIKAGLVSRMEDWEMSSFKDYAGLRNGSLCNKQLAYDLLEIPEINIEFINQSYSVAVESL